MKSEWLDFSIGLAFGRPTFMDGSKKIYRNASVTFTDVFEPFEIREIGYQNTKMSLLTRLYVHEESLSSAVKQWSDRIEKSKYGSVGFSCYNHILKPHSGESANKRSSKIGPCLQAVTLTHTRDKNCHVNTYYRSTEIFKKFPADLVFIRDVLLSRFDLTRTPVEGITFMFSNITVSPIYFSSVLSFYEDPVDLMLELQGADPKFHRATCKWMTRFLDHDAPAYKFKQARRVGEAIKRLLPDSDRLAVLDHAKQVVKSYEKEDEDDFDDEAD